MPLVIVGVIVAGFLGLMWIVGRKKSESTSSGSDGGGPFIADGGCSNDSDCGDGSDCGGDGGGGDGGGGGGD